MLDPLSGSVLLTLDDVKRIRDERNALAVKVLDLNAQLALLDSKLDAVRLFISPDVAQHLFGESGQRSEAQEKPEFHKRAKWALIVVPMLTEAGHGLTSKQMRSRLNERSQAEAGVHGHALYGGLAKLVSKGTVIKDGDYYCLPGQGRPLEEEVSGRGIYENAIRSALSAAPNGLSSAQVIGELRSGPIGPRIGKSTGYFYKVLAEMLIDKTIVKDGRLYHAIDEASQ